MLFHSGHIGWSADNQIHNWVNDDLDASDTVDYYSTSSGHWYYHTVNIPYSDSCSYDGSDDYGSEIDREQSYSISIVS